MKYLPLNEFDTVNTALNFSTPDVHVIGGCDVYTTKAAGSDKKLYKSIEHSLESKYESLVRLSESFSPPSERALSEDGKAKTSSKTGNDAGRRKRSRTAEIPEIDLSRASPFGPLSQITARRTFAYLIATLNASHPDYDFSHLLRPDDFRKEHSLRTIMHNVDSTLQNLRPKQNMAANFLAPPALMNSAPMGANISTSDIWSPRMWNLIDKEMALRQCERYSYAPDDDPFDDEEGSLWSLHYFFFNKDRKRVCYIYLRGLSVISHSPLQASPTYLLYQRPSKRSTPMRRQASSVSIGEGAGKRASYWLGNEVPADDIDTSNYDDDDDEMVLASPGDDEVDNPAFMDLDEIRAEMLDGYYYYDGRSQDDDLEEVDEAESTVGAKRRVRGMSEEIVDAMEI